MCATCVVGSKNLIFEKIFGRKILLRRILRTFCILGGSSGDSRTGREARYLSVSTE